MLGWRRQGKADADDADAGTHGEGATAHEPSARPAAATQQQAGQGAENTAKPGFFARRQVAPAASAHDSQRSLLTAVRAGSQGDVGHKSILRALQEAPHIAPSPGQLSRWWVLEFLDYEPAEAHPIAPTHDDLEGVEQTLPLFVLNPTSHLRIVWDSLIALCLIYNMLMIPFRLAFSETQVGMFCVPGEAEHSHTCPGRPWLELWNMYIWFWLDFGVDCFFLLDINLNFLTTYEFLNARGEREFEVRRGIIAWRYFCSWFPFDLITSVPVEPILYFLGHEDSEDVGIFRMLRLGRLLKLARIWRLGIFVKKIKELLDLNPALVRMVELLSIFTVLAHWLACVMFWVGTEFMKKYRTCSDDADESCRCYVEEKHRVNELPGQCSPTTWTTSKSFMITGKGELRVADMDCDMQYLVSFYWVITTMTTVGFGDIGPVAFNEFVACVAMQIVGVTVFGFMVGNMSTLAEMLQGRHGQLKEQLDAVQAFLQSLDVPKVLEKRVVKDIEHVYKTPTQVIKRDIIDDAPLKLASEIAQELFKKALERAPIFDSIPSSARDSLYLHLRPLHVAQGDILVNPGETCRELTFLLSGSLSIYGSAQTPTLEVFDDELERNNQGREDGDVKAKSLVTLYRGSYIGERCLLAGQDTFDFCAKAVEWCDILCLSARDIIASLSEEDLRRVRLAARVRQERMSALICFSNGVKPGMTLMDGGALKKRKLLKRGSTLNAEMLVTAAAEKADGGNKYVDEKSLREMLNSLDLNKRQKRLIQDVIDEACKTGVSPVWSSLLQSQAIRADLKELEAKHGTLEKAELAITGGLPPDISFVLNFGLSDVDGRSLDSKLEVQLSNILRRLHKIEALAKRNSQKKYQRQTSTTELVPPTSKPI